MKARRFFAFVASVAMLFAGGACTPDGGDGGANSEMASISVNPASFAVDLEGGEQTIAVTSNGTWVATCLEGDVVITPATGSGDGSVVVTVPTTTAARNFVVKFDVSKQTLIAGTDMVSTTKASAEVSVSQNVGGQDMNDYLYYENCGADVEKITLDNGQTSWPYTDQFNGWNPQGEAAANVAYTGKSASVRDSGGNYDPTADAVGLTGAPYVFLNKVPASAYFVIENLAVTGGSNYIFTFNVSCQTTYNPLTFATVDNTLVHLELGYDGETWDVVDCNFVPNGGNGWYAATVEFKTAAEATKLYARFSYEAPASDGGGRFDDFKLVAGGNGAELAPEVPAEPELPEQPTDPLTLPYLESFAKNQGYFLIENVTMPEELSYIWSFDSSYGMKGSAFANNTKYASESLLISPKITLAGTTAPELTFSHCVNKIDSGTPADWFTLQIKEEGATEWTQLTIPTHGTGSSWAFVDSGAIDLSAYVGKVVQFAFKYTSSADCAGTWEIKNFKVAEKPSETTLPEGATLATIVFNQKGYTNSQSVDGQTIVVDDVVSLVFNKASSSTAPAYYDASQGIRMYQNGSTLDVTANGKNIISVEFEFDYNMWYLICDSGTLSAEDSIRTWTGETSAVKFTCNGTDKTQRAYIKSIKVIYK